VDFADLWDFDPGKSKTFINFGRSLFDHYGTDWVWDSEVLGADRGVGQDHNGIYDKQQ
jgi:hypothetical protein